MKKMQVAAGLFFCFLFLLCLAHIGKLLEVPNSWFLMFVAASAAASYLLLGWTMLAHSFINWRDERRNRDYVKRITIMPEVKR